MEISRVAACRGFAGLMVLAFAMGYVSAAPESAVAHEGVATTLALAGSELRESESDRSAELPVWPFLVSRGSAAASTDSRITRAVKSELLASPELQTSSILVETQDAQVTLSGAVAYAGQARHAVEVASRVAGVKRINSRLVVSEDDAAREIEAMWRRLSI